MLAVDLGGWGGVRRLSSWGLVISPFRNWKGARLAVELRPGPAVVLGPWTRPEEETGMAVKLQVWQGARVALMPHDELPPVDRMWRGRARCGGRVKGLSSGGGVGWILHFVSAKLAPKKTFHAIFFY